MEFTTPPTQQEVRAAAESPAMEPQAEATLQLMAPLLVSLLMLQDAMEALPTTPPAAAADPLASTLALLRFSLDFQALPLVYQPRIPPA